MTAPRNWQLEYHRLCLWCRQFYLHQFLHRFTARSQSAAAPGSGNALATRAVYADHFLYPNDVGPRFVLIFVPS